MEVPKYTILRNLRLLTIGDSPPSRIFCYSRSISRVSWFLSFKSYISAVTLCLQEMLERNDTQKNTAVRKHNALSDRQNLLPNIFTREILHTLLNLTDEVRAGFCRYENDVQNV
jgi:hypothetical protein